MAQLDPFLIYKLRERYITTKVAAEYFPFSERTLENMRKNGRGPEYEIFYYDEDQVPKQLHIVPKTGIPDEVKGVRYKVYYLPSELRKWAYHMPRFPLGTSRISKTGERRKLNRLDVTKIDYELRLFGENNIFGISRCLPEIMESLRDAIE